MLIFNIKALGESSTGESNNYIDAINNWVDSHLGYSALIIGFFMALWKKLFFYKNGYNIFEIFVLLSYIFGVFFISVLFFLLIGKLLNLFIIAQVGIYFVQIYFIWAMGQFFGEKNFLNYVKSFVCLFLGIVNYKYCLILLAYLLSM